MKPEQPLQQRWISLKAARYLIEEETGHLPSRQTMYNWVKSGKLETCEFKPYRTTKALILEFLATRKLR